MNGCRSCRCWAPWSKAAVGCVEACDGATDHEARSGCREVARALGVNGNQLFKWRREFERGQLGKADAISTTLLPVTISADAEMESETADATADVPTLSGGAIRIELPDRGMISMESVSN